MPLLQPFQPPAAAVRLGLAAALACGATGPALAQTGTNGNPGGSVVVTFSRTESLTFAPATQVTQQVAAAVTEVVGRLNGGLALYDVAAPAAFGAPAVQTLLSTVTAALLAAGGPGTTLAAPFLRSSATTSSSASSAIYSLDPSTPLSFLHGGAGFVPNQSSTSTTTFGPALVNSAVDSQPSTVANPGVYSLCNITTLPSGTSPTCSAVDGGTFFVLAGQTDVNIAVNFNYLIDTATTVTNTTTLTQVYELDATLAVVPTGVPEPAGWTVLAAGLAALGLLARRSGGAGRATA